MTRLSALLLALLATSACKYSTGENNGDLAALSFSGSTYLAVGHESRFRVRQISENTCTSAHRSCADNDEYPVTVDDVRCTPSALCSAWPEPSLSSGSFFLRSDEAGVVAVRVQATFQHGTELDEFSIETIPLSSLRTHVLQLDCTDCTEGDVVDGQELFHRRGQRATLFVEVYGEPFAGGEAEPPELQTDVEARVEGNISLSVFPSGFYIHVTEPGDSSLTLFIDTLETTFTVHVE